MQYLDLTTRLESVRFQLRPDNGVLHPEQQRKITEGASPVAGKLATDGWSDTAPRHGAYRPSAYIRVSFPPSLLIIPNLCMPTCLRVRARVRLSKCVYVYIRA